MQSGTHVLLPSLSIQPALGSIAFGPLLLDVGNLVLVVLGQHLISLQVGDVTHTVVWKLRMLRLFLLSSVRVEALLAFGMHFGLLSLDEVHELLDVLKRIVVSLLILLAARTVVVLLSLVGQVLHNSL